MVLTTISNYQTVLITIGNRQILTTTIDNHQMVLTTLTTIDNYPIVLSIIGNNQIMLTTTFWLVKFDILVLNICVAVLLRIIVKVDAQCCIILNGVPNIKISVLVV